MLKPLKYIIMIKNFTPHDIHVVNEKNEIIKTYQSEGLIRLKATTVSAGLTVDDVRISKTVFGEPEGLPEYELGTFYIVSQLVKNALKEREDLLVPAEVVRDEKGQITGCKSLGI